LVAIIDNDYFNSDLYSVFEEIMDYQISSRVVNNIENNADLLII
jgi:hypothetical protein